MIRRKLEDCGLSLQWEDNPFNVSLEVKSGDELKLVNWIKSELPHLWLLHLTAYRSENSSLIILYHFLDVESHEYLRVKIPCPQSGKILGTSHLWANSYWHERELYDFWGISSDSKPSRLLLPINFVGHPLRDSSPLEPPDSLQREPLKVQLDGETGRTLGVGHFNSLELLENGYVENSFLLDGTRIVEAKLMLGFEHQGWEKLCEGCSCWDVLPLLEQVHPPHALLWGQLWCALVETLFQREITDRARALRMLVAEVVRIRDHLQTFSMMVRLLEGIGYSSFLDTLWRQLGQLLGDHAFRTSCPGGVQGDITLAWRNECATVLATLERELSVWEKVMLHSATLKERLLQDRVSAGQALELGLSGPVLRACGLNYDLRKTMPYDLYHQVDFEVPLGLYGTAYDRFLVRLEEIRQSLRIIGQLLDNFPAGEYQDSGGQGAPLAQEIYLAREGPRGEMGYYLGLREDHLTINRLKIHSASFHHAQAYEKLVVGLEVDDFALIQASWNFALSEVER